MYRRACCTVAITVIIGIGTVIGHSCVELGRLDFLEVENRLIIFDDWLTNDSE